jgi:hypothetical protein
LSGPPFRLRVRSGARSLERFPQEDEALGGQLSALVAAALARGLPRPAVLVLRAGQLDWFDAVPLMKAPPHHRRHMLSAIAGQDGVECVALLGTFRVTRPPARRGQPPQQQRALLCFIEWPDNRWWASWRLLGEDRQPLTDDPVVRIASDGWPRPGGIGGWFSLARRLNLKLKMVRSEPEVTVH